MNRNFTFLASLIVAFLAPQFLSATVFTVTNTANGGLGSLPYAIQEAQNNDTIQFSINGVFKIDSTIWITKNLSIQGSGADKTIIDGSNLHRILWIVPGDSLFMSGVTVRNGNAIADTSSRSSGGAIRNEGYLSLRECVFHDNIAKNGGAVEVSGFEGNAELFLERCTFYNNSAIEYEDTLFSAPFSGGAIYVNGTGKGKARVVAYNSTFSGNTADQSGAGIYLIGDISGGTDFFSINNTITNNSSSGAGGIRNEQFANIVLTSTIVADNPGQSTGPDIQGFINSGGHNLIGRVGSATFNSDSTDILGVSALLAPLALNGGVLPTHALSCLSQAINNSKSNASSEDQRGQIRIGNADIGAYEWTGVDEIEITHAQESGKGSLKEAILLACDGDTLDMRAIDGTINLTSPIEIDKSLTIWGNPVSPLEISGGDSLRIMNIHSGNKLIMNWFTLRNGKPELYGGGAILNKGHLEISHSTLRRNEAVGGGAIASYGEDDSVSVVLINTTISGNKASVVDGGALDIRAISYPSTAKLINCTLSNNRAVNKGGGIFNDAGGELSIQNTIIAGNHCSRGPDVYGAGNSLGNNLIGNDSDLILGNSNSDIINADPKLAYLANYGGPTFTHRLLAGSPAIDAGSNSINFDLDQRGESRIFNNMSDIGAYEYDPSTSIEKGIFSIKTSLYPNPNQGEFNLQFSEAIQIDHLQVVNIAGQVVWQTAGFEGFKNEIPVKISNLPDGIYMILLKSEQRIYQKKFILSN